VEMSHKSRRDIIESDSSAVDNRQIANPFNALEFDHAEDESRSTYPSTNVFNQGELPTDGSNSTISPNLGMQPRSYTSASPNNGMSNLLTADQDV